MKFTIVDSESTWHSFVPMQSDEENAVAESNIDPVVVRKVRQVADTAAAAEEEEYEDDDQAAAATGGQYSQTLIKIFTIWNLNFKLKYFYVENSLWSEDQIRILMSFYLNLIMGKPL